MYSKQENRVVCMDFLAFKCVSIVIVFFHKKSDDYLYLYIRNLENSRLKQYQYVCICVGR